MEVIVERHLDHMMTCPRCKSELRYDYKDIKVHFPTMDDIDSFGDNAMPFKYITCPVCNNMILLKKGKWSE